MVYYKDGMLAETPESWQIPSALREVPSYASDSATLLTSGKWNEYMVREGYKEYERPPVCTCQADGACESCRSLDAPKKEKPSCSQ